MVHLAHLPDPFYALIATRKGVAQRFFPGTKVATERRR